MNRRHLLALAAAAALAGCGQTASDSPVAQSEPPPAGAELVVLKLPGMT